MKVFIDTNIVVYLYDKRNDHKHLRANEIIEHSIKNDEVVISSQVVNEFCNVMLTKTSVLMKPVDVQRVLAEVLEPLLSHVPSIEFYQRAIKLFEQASLSYYDALIVQAAIDMGCDVLYSEDLQAGQQFGGVRVVNPFVDK